MYIKYSTYKTKQRLDFYLDSMTRRYTYNEHGVRLDDNDFQKQDNAFGKCRSYQQITTHNCLTD